MARNFQGAGVAYVNTIPSALDNLNTFTWTAWVYKNSSFGTGRVMAKRSFLGVGKNLQESGGNGTALRLDVARATTSAFAESDIGVFTTGAWKFVAGVYDSTNGPRVYLADAGGSVADVTLGSPTIGSGSEVSESDGNFCIGAKNSGAGEPIDGRIADARVYSIRMTLSEMQNVMRGALVRHDKLVAWWPLFGQSPEFDWGPNKLHATLAGTSSAVDHPAGYSLLWAQRASSTRKSGATTFKSIQSTANLLSSTTQTIGSTANIQPRATVTTKMYVTNTLPEFSYSLPQGTWDVSQLGEPNRALRTHTAGPQFSFGLVNNTSGLADRDILLGRWVSPPIKAYTFTAEDTVRWVLGVRESDTTLNAVFHIHVFVYQGNTETARGSLLADSIGATEWPTAGTGRTEGVKNLSALAALNGDRIAVEVGYRSNSTTSLKVGTVFYGGVASTGSTDYIIVGGIPMPVDDGLGSDLTDGSTAVTTEQGWIEFETSDIFFDPQTKTIQSTASIIGRPLQTIQSTASIKVTQSQTIQSTANIYGTTARTIGSTATIIVTTEQSISSTAFISSETKFQTIGSTACIRATSEKFIQSTAAIQATTSQGISSTATIQFGGVDQTITSTARIVQPAIKRRYKLPV